MVYTQQGTHSDSKVEQKWNKEMKGEVSFLTENQILVASYLVTLEQKYLSLKSNKPIRKVVFLFSMSQSMILNAS